VPDLSLLPETETPFLRALSEGIGDTHAPLAGVLHVMDDPAAAPGPVLPFMAYGRGAPLWLDRWSDSKRRLVIARLEALARTRGTLAAYTEWQRLVDADLIEFRAPPQGLSPRKAPSADQVAAWRADQPEVRIHFTRTLAFRPGRFTIGRPLTSAAQAGAFARAGLSTSADAEARLQPRATQVVDGVETPVGIIRSDSSRSRVCFALPSPGRASSFPRALTGFTLRANSAQERVYAYDDGAGNADLVTPGGRPVPTSIDKVAGSAILPGRMTIGRPLAGTDRHTQRGGRARLTSARSASERLYASVRIYDRDRAYRLGAPTRGGWTLGRSQLNQTPFTLRLAIDASRVRRGGFVIGRALPMGLQPMDVARPSEVLAAARAASLGRDKVLVRTGVFRPITAGDGIPLDGSYRVGQIIRSA
jgi:hypothetical protein